MTLNWKRPQWQEAAYVLLGFESAAVEDIVVYVCRVSGEIVAVFLGMRVDSKGSQKRRSGQAGNDACLLRQNLGRIPFIVSTEL